MGGVTRSAIGAMAESPSQGTLGHPCASRPGDEAAIPLLRTFLAVLLSPYGRPRCRWRTLGRRAMPARRRAGRVLLLAFPGEEHPDVPHAEAAHQDQAEQGRPGGLPDPEADDDWEEQQPHERLDGQGEATHLVPDVIEGALAKQQGRREGSPKE